MGEFQKGKKFLHSPLFLNSSREHAMGRAGHLPNQWKGAAEPSSAKQAWHLVNLRTMKVVKGYAQLSRIMAKMGWFFYVTPDRTFWCTWWALHDGNVEHACLPYPDLGAATKKQLELFVRRLEDAGLRGLFALRPGHLPGAHFRQSLADGKLRVSLVVRNTNRHIDTYKDLAEVLIMNGWTRVNDCHYHRLEETSVAPACYLVSVIQVPLMRSFGEVCLEDLESIMLLTGNLFYLHYSNVLTAEPMSAAAAPPPQGARPVSAPRPPATAAASLKHTAPDGNANLEQTLLSRLLGRQGASCSQTPDLQ